MKKMVLINIVTIVVLVIIGVVGFHFYNQATGFVSTDNAKVDGEQIKISAPASGEIKSFDVKNNEKLRKNGLSCFLFLLITFFSILFPQKY